MDIFTISLFISRCVSSLEAPRPRALSLLAMSRLEAHESLVQLSQQQDILLEDRLVYSKMRRHLSNAVILAVGPPQDPPSP